MNVGCNLAGINVNLLAYADDLVLLAPSWSALQSLLQAAEAAATKLGGGARVPASSMAPAPMLSKFQ